jgi:hypothetical protein
MIWLAISAFAVVGLLFVLALCRAASHADMAGLHLPRHVSEHLDLTKPEARDETQSERGA